MKLNAMGNAMVLDLQNLRYWNALGTDLLNFYYFNI